ncbi:MAG: endolytic transglycosylase MltG [Anaerolineaceae bacterium]|nr:endolytic transglycosylase MltG [Anaerolineaceae bacterium]MDD4042008.1 endolytic transglycosylase MltG [Anaerolineaceae bacterium]MDD4577556.1 endolytic transglycosylase MltG [Anaerolineaceae bacterium]
MTRKRRRLPVLLIIFFVLAIGLVLFMMYAVYSNSQVFGAPGEDVHLLNNLRYSIRLFLNQDLLQNDQVFEERKFTISNNDSARDVCHKLEAESFIFSGTAICDYLIYKGQDRTLSPGTYTLKSGMNSIQVANFIAERENQDLRFTIFAGWRLEEIAEIIGQLGLPFSGHEFLSYAYAPPVEIAQVVNLPAHRSLEGYMHPGFYSLKPDISLEEFVLQSISRTHAVIQEASQLLNAQSSTLSYDELIILASIIQRETQHPTEMSTIASVFFNRLAIGMRLETDPTVQYALGYDLAQGTWWKSPLTFADLAVVSDYNTYQVKGLPPGAISNPSRETIMAAFAPEQTGYYFFRAKCDGSMTHNFAVTFEEHLANGCE